jgi:hypothetical protein
MLFDYLVDMPPIIKNDLIKMICGKCIGAGIHRQVYEHRYNEDLVIKIECADTKVFANIREWVIWNELEFDPMRKFFAPCVDISENGLILIQKRTKPMKKYPEKIPAFFTDTKIQNYGSYKGQFVCHDYAGNLLLQKGTTTKLVKADWWGY